MDPSETIGGNREAPEVTVTEVGTTRSSIVNDAENLGKDHSARLQTARCIFVPQAGRGNYEGQLFFGTTPELLAFLEDQDFSAEIPVADEAYKELALHADTTWLGILLVNHEDAIALVRLLAQWLSTRFAKRAKQGHLDVSLDVQNGDTSKRVHYKGPVRDFEETMKAAVDGLNDLK